MRLRRPKSARGMAPLTSIIDVLLILLFFFMITSSYLDLDMVPLVAGDETAPPEAAAPGPSGPASTLAVLVRLGPDGRAWLGGVVRDGAGLTEALRARLASRPGVPVLILPSPRATVQDLVRVMEAAGRAGAATVRVLRSEAGP